MGPSRRCIRGGGGTDVSHVVAIVLNYNTANDTVRCVCSLREALPAQSIVVVDNGSTDGSAASIRAWLPNVKLIETGKNLGYSGGNNVGARYALGSRPDFLLFLNSDTEVIDASFVDSLCSVLEERDAAGIAGPLVRLADGTIQPTVSDAPSLRLALTLALAKRLRRSLGQPSTTTEVAVLNGVCLLVRSAAFEATDGFDEQYFLYVEEADFAARARSAGWTSVYAPTPSIVHHHAAGDDRGSGMRVRINFVRFCLGHRGFLSALGCALLFLASALARDLRKARLQEAPLLVRGLLDLAAGRPT
jgi:GT2 family glycosyltransferase